METVTSKKLLKSKAHHPGSNRRTLDHLPTVIPLSYCGRERPWPNSKKIVWHDSYVILWAHPEVPGSIPTLNLSFFSLPKLHHCCLFTFLSTLMIEGLGTFLNCLKISRAEKGHRSYQSGKSASTWCNFIAYLIRLFYSNQYCATQS